jgi:hypothetical protein
MFHPNISRKTTDNNPVLWNINFQTTAIATMGRITGRKTID